jgi:hypothetical protein
MHEMKVFEMHELFPMNLVQRLGKVLLEACLPAARVACAAAEDRDLRLLTDFGLGYACSCVWL